VDEVGVTDGQPDSVSAGDHLPVDFDLTRSQLFPTSGGVVATEAHLGKDYDIYVDANGIQYVNLNAQTYGVLRIAGIETQDGLTVSCVIPPDLRYGNL
jgi:hypothetical protein